MRPAFGSAGFHSEIGGCSQHSRLHACNSLAGGLGWIGPVPDRVRPHSLRGVAKWLIMYGQVAHMTTAATLRRRHGGTPKTDVDRFRQYSRRGVPGPHAYVILLGLDTFDAPGLLRAVARGLAYRAFERFRQNTSLSLERLTGLIDVPRRTMTRRKR